VQWKAEVSEVSEVSMQKGGGETSHPSLGATSRGV